MDKTLIEAILNRDQEIIPKVFKEDFQHPVRWLQYLEGHFGKAPVARIETILDKRPVIEEKAIISKNVERYKDRWHAAGFQALYIACWVYQPLEKGSFMIKLTPQQLENARRSVKGMGTRTSSHLTAQSYTAAGGALKHFGFIQGYDELLVILQDDWLFLKMEGESSSHPMHWGGFLNKAVTGHGFISNEYLNKLPENNIYGIVGRAAENYNSKYEELLKKLQVPNKQGRMVSLKEAKGKMVTIMDMFNALMREFDYREEAHSKFRTTYGFFNNSSNINVDGAITELCSKGDNSGNRRLKELSIALRAAKNDIKGIVESVRAASRRMPKHGNEVDIDQIFHEVRVEPSEINKSLNEFLTEIGSVRP